MNEDHPGARPHARHLPLASTPRLQRGQALTEMAILAVVLVPLFLLIPMLAKYAHMRQVTQQATRAAAWEATAVHAHHWESSLANDQWRSRRRDLLIDRHFGTADAQIRSEPEQAQQDASVPAIMMNTFSDQPLLKRDGIMLEAFDNESGGALSQAMESVGGLMEALPNEFPPNSDGLVTAHMVVNPENLKLKDGSEASFLAPFDAINLSMQGQHALLADTWGASGSGLIDAGSATRNNRRVKDQVGTFVPSSWISGVSDVLEKVEFMEKVPLIGVPFRIRPGYMQPDIVPHDRLQEYQE
ncbi:TadE family protein [Marilutibacter aestuarii]|nr:TadE family protein [Lysobacter aestuarii]